ncbi:IS607 family element RNA-guided endonuclease TnpB [Amycolatopsis sp. NPDC059657]|uniref:IS607 family element RNA-guided endonuclease TnpB n=1 Tax=Amycolatopsis sp. NPDC059657 TaxID=3346899 RepID=UPI00366B6858
MEDPVVDLRHRPASTVLQAYRFALDPNPEQNAALRSHCGGLRFAFNWGLAQVKANLGQREAETSYGLCGHDLTPPLSWSAYSLRKDWNVAKRDVAPWWAENSKEAYSSGLANLAVALKNWGDSKNGKRRGRKLGFPRFKSKRARMACKFTTGGFGLAGGDRRHVKLPRIGVVRTCESTRKLARHVEHDTARIRSATVSYQSGRWFVSFSVEITRTYPVPEQPDVAVGVDLGVKSLAVVSTGEVVPNPRHLELAQRELRRLQRRSSRRHGPDKRTKTKPSRRWHQTQARIARLHAWVANSRLDGLHKFTTGLVRAYGTIVIEDLNVSGMLANRWYPSSKSCSDCGVVKAKLRLSERVFTCDSCGMTMDRDLNAARNLAGLAETSSPSCGATENEPDGNPGKSRTARAAGTATGRPHHQCGQRRYRKVPTREQGTL